MITKLNLHLVKPSKYDDDGYVIRHWKGVLPSNTLACLYGLCKDLEARQVLGKQLKWDIEAVDETVQRVPVRKIIRQSRQKHAKTIVCFIGVQSNQFPRTSDLALEFRRAGVDVLIGGFHVSGAFSTLPEPPPEIRELQEAGATMVAGEVEGRLETILRDALSGTLKPVYNFLSTPADLSNAPMPEMPKNLLNRYAVTHFGTLDCSRGCPFGCSFCTVINVHGRGMRFRPVDAIEKLIRNNYHQLNIYHYFFTDDNFCRNQNWNAIFDMLIRLREKENMPIDFMIQVDTQSYRIPDFITKAARAGCTQVFLGMESLNEENLKAVGKKQNLTADFKQLIKTYHDVGIATNLAYIIGFPFDSEASVQDDMIRLRELESGQASFFMLMPLPGSVDYCHALSNGSVMDADLNNFDSFHETFAHSRLKAGAWTRSYGNAWQDFYGLENMKRILKKADPRRYWDIFLKFIWYKNSIQVENDHPMLQGFFRRKSRKERRKIYPMENHWAYFKRRISDMKKAFSGWLKLAMEMEEVWLETRKRSALEERVVFELSQYQKQMVEWRNLHASELQVFYQKAAVWLEHRVSSSVQIPSRFQLWFEKRNIFSNSLTSTRRSLNDFWKNFRHYLKRGEIERIHLLKVIYMGLWECVLLWNFVFALASKSYARPNSGN